MTRKVEETVTITTLSEEDKEKLKTMFKDEFVCEARVNACQKCGFEDVNLELKKCTASPDNIPCDGEMKVYKLMHNAVQGGWKKEYE